MARFELKEKHCLRVPGNEWEREEVDPISQKPIRKRYQVDQYLDPENIADCNYRDPPRIIVSTKFDPAWPRDIIFEGQATIDMTPLDPEAEAMVEKAKAKFNDPMRNFDVNMSEKLLLGFQAQIGELQARINSGQGPAPQQVPISVPDDTRVQALEAELAEMKVLLQGLVAKESEEVLHAPQPPSPTIARRV